MRSPGTNPERAARRRRGSALIEMTLVTPWLLFLFAGTMDMGFYTYSLIAVQNAARVAALYTSASSRSAADAGGACQYALTEMNTLSNVRNLRNCSSLPLTVAAAAVTGIDGEPASLVTVTYRSVALFTIPGLPGQITMQRAVQMRVTSQ